MVVDVTRLHSGKGDIATNGLGQNPRDPGQRSAARGGRFSRSSDKTINYEVTLPIQRYTSSVEDRDALTRDDNYQMSEMRLPRRDNYF